MLQPDAPTKAFPVSPGPYERKGAFLSPHGQCFERPWAQHAFRPPSSRPWPPLIKNGFFLDRRTPRIFFLDDRPANRKIKISRQRGFFPPRVPGRKRPLIFFFFFFYFCFSFFPRSARCTFDPSTLDPRIIRFFLPAANLLCKSIWSTIIAVRRIEPYSAFRQTAEGKFFRSLHGDPQRLGRSIAPYPRRSHKRPRTGTSQAFPTHGRDKNTVE